MDALQLALIQRIPFIDILPTAFPKTDRFKDIIASYKEERLATLLRDYNVSREDLTPKLFFEKFILGPNNVMANMTFDATSLPFISLQDTDLAPNLKPEFSQGHGVRYFFYVIKGGVNPFVDTDRIPILDIKFNLIQKIVKYKIPYRMLYDNDKTFSDRFTGHVIHRFWNSAEKYDTYDVGICALALDVLPLERNRSNQVVYGKLLSPIPKKLLIFYKLITPYDVTRNLVVNSSSEIEMIVISTKVISLEEYDNLYSPVPNLFQ